MFHGFDPATRDLVFERRNRRSFVVTTLSFVVLFGSWIYLGGHKEAQVDVLLEPEIKDFAVEEEPEPEPEEEPPPPPPPDVAPKPKADKPKPKPKPEVPKVIPDGPPPEQDKPAEDKNFGTGTNPGAGTGKPKPEVKKPEVKKPEVKKPEPPKAEPIDPTKPVDRPEKASVPQAEAGNKAPDYPKDLRDAGVEGEVVVKLHVHRDGTVKGAKILRSTNTATGDEEKTAADKAFKGAVIAAIKAWKYTPSKLDGQPISVWIIVNFPFKLTAG